MKKFLVFLAAMLLVFGVVGVAGAITFTDSTQFYSDHTDPNVDLNSSGGQYVNELEYATDWVSWTHHFNFDPAAVVINSAELRLAFTDDDCEYLLWGFIPIGYELGLGWGEDWSFDFGEIDSGVEGPYTLNVNYLYDGMFSATVMSVGGDFYIDRSELTIDYEPVPEPATMLLLGSGLIGLAGLGRKKFFKKS